MAPGFALVSHLLLAFPISLFGQVPDSLTLSAVYRVLDQGTPSLTAARASARAAASRIAPARRLPDPRVQFGLQNRMLPDLGPDPVLGMTEVQLTQMIPTAGKLGIAGRIARARADAAEEQVAEVWWSERARAAMAFYELYQIDRTVLVTRETQDILRQMVATTETMYAVGEGGQPDVLRAQVELARMTEDLIVMQAMRVAAGARLNAILNRGSSTPVPPPVLPTLPDSLPSSDALETLALAHRPMLRAGGSEVRAARAAEQLARREIWPDVEAGIQYGWRPMARGTDRMVSFMVGFTLPIWAGSRQLAMRNETRAMREMAEADLQAMEAATRGRITELVADIRRARTLIELYRRTIIPQAQTTVASSQSAYRVGSVNFMTLLEAAMNVNRFRQELFRMEAELGQAIAEMEMMTGTQLVNSDAAPPVTLPGESQ